MTLSYLGRLLLLSSAAFFLLQMFLEALVASIAPVAIRRTAAMPPQRAARFLLTLRLLPTALSVILVAALCVPSYLRFEPQSAEEEVGLACLVAAIFGAAICARAISKTIAALIRSSRLCNGTESSIEGEKVWIVPQSAGLALAGILRPRLLISEPAIQTLSRDQLAVALRHERAHRSSCDNLKRLLILLSPSIFPTLRLLERAWAKSAEWSADDQAAAGDEDRSVLAEALVRVARLQSGVRMPPLVTSLVEADEDLSNRVDRLLAAPPACASSLRNEAIALSGIALLVVFAALNPTSLRIVHQLLERLLD